MPEPYVPLLGTSDGTGHLQSISEPRSNTASSFSFLGSPEQEYQPETRIQTYFYMFPDD